MVYALRYTGTARCCLCIPGQVSKFQRVLSNYSTTTTTHIAVFVILGEVPGDRCKVFFIVRTLSRLSKTFVSGLVRRRCMYRSRTRCDIPRCLVEYSKTVFDVTAILYWNDIYIYIYIYSGIPEYQTWLVGSPLDKFPRTLPGYVGYTWLYTSVWQEESTPYRSKPSGFERRSQHVKSLNCW